MWGLGFDLNQEELLAFLKEKTDLYERYTSREDRPSYNFIDFCNEVIWDEAKSEEVTEVPFSYYDDIDIYHVAVHEYQGIFYVTCGEYDPLGYFLTKKAAQEAADSHINEVYDDYAWERYRELKEAGDLSPI